MVPETVKDHLNLGLKNTIIVFQKGLKYQQFILCQLIDLIRDFAFQLQNLNFQLILIFLLKGEKSFLFVIRKVKKLFEQYFKKPC